MLILKLFFVFMHSAFAIWYGEKAIEPEYSSVVHLRVGNSECSGIVYNEHSILTAGHCIEWFDEESDQTAHVSYTSHYGQTTTNLFNITSKKYPHYISPLHPNDTAFDIGIIKTKENILSRFSSLQLPQLAGSAQIYNMPNLKLVAVGFGWPKRSKLNNFYRTKLIDVKLKEIANYITVHRHNQNQSIGPGDSGGALFVTTPVGVLLVGLQSAITDEKSFFVYLPHYINWIKENIN